MSAAQTQFEYRAGYPFALVISLLALGCTQDSDPVSPPSGWANGPYVAAHTTLVIDDSARARSLTVEVWYPGVGSVALGAAVAEFEALPESRSALRELLQAATPGCPSLLTQANRDAPAIKGLGGRPLVMFSHCYNCGRYSSFSLAERLASHGMIVVAPDHAGPMPFVEEHEGESLDAEQLEQRVDDLRLLISASLDGSLFELSSVLEGLSIDPQRIGAYGHSFGSATTGRLAQVDSQIRAAAGLAAPMASFVFPSVAMDEISVPLLFVLAQEDNSITEIGNDLLRNNIAEAASPVWVLELADAGHWSVSDLCGLVPAFEAGCGQGLRHSRGREGEAFAYIPVRQGIQTTQGYLTTFFLAHLAGDAPALALLNTPLNEEGVVWRMGWTE